MARERSARRYTGDKSPCDIVFGGTKRFNGFLAEGGKIAIPGNRQLVGTTVSPRLQPRPWRPKRASVSSTCARRRRQIGSAVKSIAIVLKGVLTAAIAAVALVSP